jgi:hypothetical protein
MEDVMVEDLDALVNAAEKEMISFLQGEELDELGSNLLELNRTLKDIADSVEEDDEDYEGGFEKGVYDTFIQTHTARKKLDNFFKKVTIGITSDLIGDEYYGNYNDIDFLKVFEAKANDERNFMQILGAENTESDPNCKMSDNIVKKAGNILSRFGWIADKGFLDFQMFIEAFGRVPFAYFEQGAGHLMTLGGYKNYADLFVTILFEGGADMFAKKL